MTTNAGAIVYPWQSRSPLRGNLAIGNLRENLRLKLQTNQGIHAPTLLTYIGAVAGFAAQHALWKTIISSGKPVPNGVQGGPIPQAGFLSVTTKTGEIFYFGNLLNAYLTPSPDLKRLHLWGFVVAAAASAGLPADGLPPLAEMYAHVAQSVGTAVFGLPRVSVMHKPSVTAPKAIKTAWPFIHRILSMSPPQQMRTACEEPPLVEEDWPIIASSVAGQFMKDVKDVLDPRAAAVLIMESAIAASKIDPKTVVQNRTAA